MASLTLFSDGLLSKWGFGDGDNPDSWYDYCDDHGIDSAQIAWRPLLCQLVHRYLLPVLDQNVTVIEISTIHNPIRAETVDGIDVTGCWYEDCGPSLTPERVEIPFEEVLRVARETTAVLSKRQTEER